MHIWLHKIEVLVDRLIPPLLAALLIVIVGELFFSHQFEWYRHYADWFDGLVIAVFAIDLGFKYSRVRKMPTFLKKYWLEILATIPFFLAFRFMELLKATEFIEKGQSIAHEGLAAAKIEKEAVVVVREAARAGEVTRTARMISMVRTLRFSRLLKAIPFFEKPTGKHHWHEKRTHQPQKQQHF